MPAEGRKSEYAYAPTLTLKRFIIRPLIIQEQCDAQRPTCSACQGDTAHCIYRDNGKRAAGGSRVEEIARLLDSLPEEQVEQVLGVLQSQAGLGRIVSVLRGGVEITRQPFEFALASTILDLPFVSLELGAQNPIAYPFLTPIQKVFIDQDTLARLTQSRGQPSTLPLYVRSLPKDISF
jgi:hypothetical protein